MAGGYDLHHLLKDPEFTQADLAVGCEFQEEQYQFTNLIQCDLPNLKKKTT